MIDILVEKKQLKVSQIIWLAVAELAERSNVRVGREKESE